MSDKRLSATLLIGGAVTSTLGAAIGSTKGKLAEIGSAAKKLAADQKALAKEIKIGEAAGQNVDALRRKYVELGKSIDSAKFKVRELKAVQKAEQAIGEARGQFRGNAIGMTASGIGLAATLKEPLDAFRELDKAQTELKTAMTSSGGLPAQFGEIMKKAVALGSVLPGTTADFVAVGTALKQKGVGADSILGGALEASSHLGVVLGQIPKDAAEMVATLRSSFGLADKEFKAMADLSQRTKFGFGLDPDDLKLGAQYYGSVLNTLGVKGIDNVKKIYALQGQAKVVAGIDGSKFGTNFATMLTRVGTMKTRLGKESKEMKAINDDLRKSGISLDFFTKGGKFAGVDNLVVQLGKLNKLTQEDKIAVLHKLFGEEGSRVASIIAQGGVEGYTKALQTIDLEADLDTRIGIITSSFDSKLEALGGTFRNTLAEIGEPIAEMFQPAIDGLGAFLSGPVQTWINEHPTLVKTIGAVIIAGAGLLLIGGAINGMAYAGTFALGGLVKATNLVTVAWTFGKTAALMFGRGMMFLGRGAMMLVTRTFPALISTLWSVSAAFFATPVGWVVGGILLIAGAALLIWKYWEPISEFCSNLWGQVTETIGAAYGWIVEKLGFDPLEALRPVWEPVVKWFGEIGSALVEAFKPALEWIYEKLGAIAEWWGDVKKSFAFDDDTFSIPDIGDIFSDMGAPGTLPANDLAPAANNQRAAPPGLAPNYALDVPSDLATGPRRGSGGRGGKDKLPLVDVAPLPSIDQLNATMRGQSKQYVDNSKSETSIVIHQQPGESAQSLADKVIRIIDDRTQKRSRGAMYDRVGG